MTYEVGDKTKPPIVLIHGYGGSALIFFKLFKHFKENYHVIMIDLLGKGASSRPEFLAKDKEEAEIFHLQAVEKWRQAMELDKFTLIGHSFGGYVAAKYAITNHHRIEKLLLWSPLGVEKWPDDLENFLREQIREVNWFTAVFNGTTRLILNQECNVFNFLRCLGRSGKWFVRKYIRDSFPDFTEEEATVTYPYFYQTTMLKESGENALYKILRTHALAYSPYFDDLEELRRNNIEVSFVYGDKDWLDTDINKKKVSQQLKEAGYKVDILENCGHHLYFDNYEGLLKLMDETLQKQDNDINSDE